MRARAECGTYSAYLRHVKNHEPVDDACRRANAVRWRERHPRDGRRQGVRRNRRVHDPVTLGIVFSGETAERVGELAEYEGIGVSEAVERLVLMGLDHVGVG